MANFSYKAINKSGANVKGDISASDKNEATSKLKSQGLIVVGLDEKKTKQSGGSLFQPKVKLGDLSLFCRQLASLLGAGIPLMQGISSLSKQSANPTLGNALVDIEKRIGDGATLSEAFEAYPKIFSPLMLSMISAGELSGQIEEALEKISTQLQKEKTIQDTINSAFIYPKIILSFAGLLFVGILIFIVPRFESFLPDPEQAPAITKMVFALSHNIRDFWYLWIIGLIVLFFAVKMIFKTKLVIRAFDSFKISMPLLGPLFYKTIVARFIRAIASMLDSGITLMDALKYAGPVAGNDKFQQASLYISEQIHEGKTLILPFQETGLFEPMVLNMISAGEESGSISEMLNRLAEFYEEEVAILTKGIFSILEPILIVFVAIAIGGILLALYMPIFTVVTG